MMIREDVAEDMMMRDNNKLLKRLPRSRRVARSVGGIGGG